MNKNKQNNKKIKSAKIIIDIESDGPVPGLYSMVSFGAVLIKDGDIFDTFYGQTRPLEGADWIPDALAVSGHSRDEHLSFDDPAEVMRAFYEWIVNHTGYEKGKRNTRPLFFSDNNGFDWSFINYYFVKFLGVDSNPFGHTSRNICDIYKGMINDMFKNPKHLGKTKHTHHPVDDATRMAEILIEMKKMGLRISL